MFFHIRNCPEIRDSSELIKGYIEHCIDAYDDEEWENRKHFYGSIHRKSRRRQETIYLYINLVHSDTSLKVYAGIEGYKWTIKLPYKTKVIPEPNKTNEKNKQEKKFQLSPTTPNIGEIHKTLIILINERFYIFSII